MKIIKEQSTASWDTVDKSKLPASCYLWVEDPDKKTTWHLPVYEGAGGIDPETGMYRERGEINLNALRAASAAVAGARTGKPMDIPAEVRAKLDGLLKKYKIGKYSESIIDEFTESLKEAKVEDNVIRNVSVLSAHSKNRREYTDAALREASVVFEGALAFANHKDEERDIREIIGRHRNLRFDEGKRKVYSDLVLLENQAEWVLPLVENMSDVIGNSINGKGEVHTKDGVEIVEHIHDWDKKSIDLVCYPATTTGLFESQSKEEGMEEVKELKEKIATLEDENKKLKIEIDGYIVKEMVAKKKEEIAKLLSESKLPAEAITDTFVKILEKVEEKKDGDKVVSVEEQIKELIEDRVKLVELDKSKVKNMGEKSSTGITEEVKKEIKYAIKA